MRKSEGDIISTNSDEQRVEANFQTQFNLASSDLPSPVDTDRSKERARDRKVEGRLFKQDKHIQKLIGQNNELRTMLQNAQIPTHQQVAPMPNLNVRAFTYQHPSFLEAWPDPTSPVQKIFATSMSVLIPKLALAVTIYLAQDLVLRREVLFHPQMEQQILFDLGTKLSELSRYHGHVGYINEPIMQLWKFYWYVEGNRLIWHSADRFEQRNFNVTTYELDSPYNDLARLYPSERAAKSVNTNLQAYENAIAREWIIKSPLVHHAPQLQP